MLPPDARAALTEQLRPPPGFELTRGVATTFTLDLTSALMAPLSFASHRLGSGQDPISIMEAVRAAADRLDIFCQAGQMTVPAKASDLVAFLEPMIHPVRPPRAGRLFHPKVWLLEFSDGADTAFRLICTSRNLTADRSWDVVVRLDGTRGSRISKENAPLRDLVNALPQWAIGELPATRVERIIALADSLRYAEWEHPDDVRDVAFHLLGLPGKKHSVDFNGARHLVIAPFCNDDGLKTVISSETREAQVVSRVEDLDRLDSETVDWLGAMYVLDELAGLEDEDEQQDASADLLVGLHAKTYIVERGHQAHVYLGSANATGAAFTGNVEFLVELVGTKSKLGIDSLVGEKGSIRTLLAEYDAEGGRAPTPDEEADYRLQQALRTLAAVPLNAQVEPQDDGYTLVVTAGSSLKAPAGFRTVVELLTRQGDAHELSDPVHVEFTKLDLVEITPFLVLRMTDERGATRSTVVRAQLSGDPPQRRDEILARQVDTPEKFLRFLALLLALSGERGLISMIDDGGAGAGSWSAGTSGVFETLVRALAGRLNALDDVARLVNRLRESEHGRDVLPQGFDDLWQQVWSARQKLAEAEK